MSWLKLHLLLPITPIANVTPFEPSPTPSMENWLPQDPSLGPKRLRTAALHGVREGVCPGVGPEWWLACPPLCVAECREQAPHPLTCLLPASQKWQSACSCPFFCVCVSFLIFLVQNLPQLHMHAVIFSCIWFLCIFQLKQRCIQVQALQHCSQEPQVLGLSERDTVQGRAGPLTLAWIAPLGRELGHGKAGL